jgi:hypothetical protein
MTILKLTERLGLTEACIEVYDDVDRIGLRAATTGQGIVRMLAVRKF